MNANLNHTNKNDKEHRSHPHTLYLVNIIFLCCLTIASLLFALITFFGVSGRGMAGMRKFYTARQIDSIREEAEEKERRSILLQIQSSLESGRSTTQMLREIFYESKTIVVVKGGRYYFYPMIDDVERNPLPYGALERSGRRVASAGYDELDISCGVVLSDANGKIDWERFADSGIEEIMLAAGNVVGNGLARDEQLDRNWKEAFEKEIKTGLCFEISEPVRDEMVAGVSQAVRDTIRECREAVTTEGSLQDQKEFFEDLPILLRLRAERDVHVEKEKREEWTRTIRSLCDAVKKEGGVPVIGGDLFTFAAQFDLKGLKNYPRWLIEHDEIASFPYSFLFWEYSLEGHMEGVPGDAVLYARIENTEAVKEIMDGAETDSGKDTETEAGKDSEPDTETEAGKDSEPETETEPEKDTEADS